MSTGISIQRAANDTAEFGSDAILPTEVASKFMRRVIDGAPTLRLIRDVMMTSPTLKVPKIATSRRMLRKGSEGVAPRDQQPFDISSIDLSPAELNLAYELTYKLSRDSVERQMLAQTLAQMTEARIGTDLNDLVWNGDTTDYSSAATTLSGSHSSSVTTITVVSTSGFPTTSGGFGFLVIESERVEYTGVTSTTFTGATRGADATTAASHSNGVAVTFVQDALYPAFNGVRAKVSAAGQIVDLSAIGDGTLSLDSLEALLDLVPAKYRNSNASKASYRWCANDLTVRRWRRYLGARQTGGGDAVLNSNSPEAVSPLGIAWNMDEHVPTGTIVLAPMNQILLGVRTDNIRRVSTSEGKDLKSRDAIYYKWSLEADVEIEETEAFAMGTSLVTTIS